MPTTRKCTMKAIKNKEGMHPYSRKAFQMNRVFLRQDKLEQAKSIRHGLNDLVVDRYLTFQEALEEGKEVYTRDEMHAVMEQYVGRYDEELEEVKGTRRAGRPKSAREGELERARTRDMDAYTAGVNVPDLTTAKNVKLLREWDGDFNSITQIRTLRISSKAVPSSSS